MSVNPAEVVQDISDGAASLDGISKALQAANDRMDAAESGWDTVYDAVAESLKDEMADEGRKGDPAEHWITSVARRQHRLVYQEWRNSKREVARLAQQLKANSDAISGRQTLYKALADEARWQDQAAQHRPRAVA